MIVYVDLVSLINLLFDSTLLLSVDLTLKRNTKWYRIILGGLVGELSLITLFVNMNGITLLVFKVLVSILMSLAAFNYKDIKYTFYNVCYLYFIGIILGGFITYLYNEFQVNREYSIKYLVILFLSPLTLSIYYFLMKRFKNNYNNRHNIKIEYDGRIFSGVGYLDSGNKLISPISNKPIILVEKEYITLHKLRVIPIPYNALNHHGLLNCFKPERVYIDEKEYQNVLIGISDVRFNIEGCNVLLNARLEGL